MFEPRRTALYLSRQSDLNPVVPVSGHLCFYLLGRTLSMVATLEAMSAGGRYYGLRSNQKRPGTALEVTTHKPAHGGRLSKSAQA
jgi:hypothetical protein